MFRLISCIGLVSVALSLGACSGSTDLLKSQDGLQSGAMSEFEKAQFGAPADVKPAAYAKPAEPKFFGGTEAMASADMQFDRATGEWRAAPPAAMASAAPPPAAEVAVPKPFLPQDDISLGKKYYRNRDYGLAEKHFRTAAETHPRNPEAWLGLAASYDELRRFDLADRAYGQVIRIAGETVEIMNNQGYSYILRGDYKRARERLLLASVTAPDNPYVQANLALLAKRSGRPSMAAR